MGYISKAAFYGVLTPPSGAPVDLATLKSHLRVTSTAEDAILQIYLDTAIEEVEACTNVLTRPADFTGNYGTFEYESTEYDLFVKLERSPFRAVTEVRAWDGDSFEVVDPVEYRVENKSTYARVLFDNFADFNFLTLTAEGPEQPYPIQVDFSAGPADAANAPGALKLAILHYAAWLYDNRGDCEDATMPSTISKLISKHRIVDVYA